MQNLHGIFRDWIAGGFDSRSNQEKIKRRFLASPFQNARVFENQRVADDFDT